LTITGPVTAAALAHTLGMQDGEADAALLALESEGVVLRGRFTPERASATMEWCDRALLARIHRYTLNRLRAEIEPVSPADFMRFLFKWQHVDEASRLTGRDGLRQALELLDGFELPARAWERAVLPSRMDRYDPSMLDMLCLSGEVGWARLSVSGVLKVSSITPISLFLSEHAELWQSMREGQPDVIEAAMTDDARIVLHRLGERGASFLKDLAAAVPFDLDRLRQALSVLVASGLVASDGFAGLRMLVAAAHGRPVPGDRRTSLAGRWSALPGEGDTKRREAAVERQARSLLRRYGIVCRRLLTREPNAAPWRDLSRVYRRLEARGEIRGGRFVSGLAGEQYALPDAIPVVREVRRTPATGRFCAISTADPLNLAGIVTAGPRVRAAGRNRMVYRDGVPVAVMENHALRTLTPLDATELSVAAQILSEKPRMPQILHA
jgi:ATP-dependent Lhr-like helicase